MKLQLLDAIGEITEARTAAGLWQQGQGCSLTGLSGAAKTVFLAALDRLLPEWKEVRRELERWAPLILA